MLAHCFPNFIVKKSLAKWIQADYIAQGIITDCWDGGYYHTLCKNQTYTLFGKQGTLTDGLTQGYFQNYCAQGFLNYLALRILI